MERKNSLIDVVKGLGIILVVYGHVIQRTMVLNGEDFFLNPAFSVIYTFHMPLFVFISGYLMAASLSRRNAGLVFQSRCQGLLVPYLSWGLLGVVATYALGAMDGKVPGLFQLPQVLLDQLLWDPAVWFLFTLFVLSAFLLLMIRMSERLVPWAFVAGYFLLLLIPYREKCALYYIQWFYLFYVAGYFFNKWAIDFRNVWISRLFFGGGTLLFCVLAAYWIKNDYIYINKMAFTISHVWDDVLRLLYRYGVGFAGITAAFCVGAFLSRLSAGALLGFVGVYSLDIYLIQRYLVEGFFPRIMTALEIRVDTGAVWFLPVFVPVMTVILVGLCIIISWLFIRRNHVLNKLFLGGRGFVGK